jgi:hypothetical protein
MNVIVEIHRILLNKFTKAGLSEYNIRFMHNIETYC